MSEWNDAIELAAQLCEKLGRELRGAPVAAEDHVRQAVTAFGIAAVRVRELKKPVPKAQQPSVGRIVHVMIRRGAGLHLRPAIITRVGPVKVSDPDVPGRVGLHVFWAPEDYGDISYNPPGAIEADYNPEDREWLENHWRWPSRV